MQTLTSPVNNLQTNKVQRIIWLDIARTFAIITVLLVHATEHVYKMNVVFFNGLGLYTRLFAHTTFTIGRLGVPIFLFLTGYLLLGKYYTEQDCQLFWKKKWLNLVVTTEIWILIYNFFLFCTKKSFSFVWTDLLKEMLFLKQVPWMSHMWYMPMIIGMYLFLPVFSRSLNKMDITLLKVPLILIGVYLTILPSLGGKKLLDFGYCGGLYGFYILLGFVVKKKKFFGTKKLIGVCFCSLIGAVFLQHFLYLKGITYNAFYNCGLVTICSFCIFALLSNHAMAFDPLGLEVKNIIHKLSIVSFSIYLIHFPVLLLLQDAVRTLKLSLPAKVLVLWIATFLLSVVVSVFASKLKLVRKYLLYIETL